MQFIVILIPEDSHIYYHRFCIGSWIPLARKSKPRFSWFSGPVKCVTPIGSNNLPFCTSSPHQPFMMFLRFFRPTSVSPKNEIDKFKAPKFFSRRPCQLQIPRLPNKSPDWNKTKLSNCHWLGEPMKRMPCEECHYPRLSQAILHVFKNTRFDPNCKSLAQLACPSGWVLVFGWGVAWQRGGGRARTSSISFGDSVPKKTPRVRGDNKGGFCTWLVACRGHFQNPPRAFSRPLEH